MIATNKWEFLEFPDTTLTTGNLVQKVEKGWYRLSNSIYWVVGVKVGASEFNSFTSSDGKLAEGESGVEEYIDLAGMFVV